MLAARADAQSDRSLEEHDVRDDHEHEARPGEDAQIPDRLFEEVAEPPDMDVRGQGDVARDLAVVELHEEVAGDADCEEVDPRPAHDLVGAEMDREVRIEE